HRHGHRFGSQPHPLAGLAGALSHQALVLFSHVVGGCLLIAALHGVDHAFPGGVVGASISTAGLIVHRIALLAGAVQDDLALRLGQFAPGLVSWNLVRFSHLQQQRHAGAVRACRPGILADGAPFQAQLRVGDDQIGVEFQAHAKPLAGRASTVRVVETERARFDLRDRAVSIDAGQFLAVQIVFGVGRIGHVVDDDHALAHFQRRLNRVGQPGTGGAGLVAFRIVKVPYHQPIYHHFDGVALVAFQLDFFVHVVDRAIDPHAHKTGLAHVLEDFLVAALAILDERGKHLDTRAVRHSFHSLDDLLRALRLYYRAADRAVWDANPRIEQTQVVVDFGDGSNGGARIAAHTFLVNRHSRREALDLIHVGLFHLPDKRPRVGRERLDVTTLALRENGVESQRRLAATRQPGDDHQLVARDVDVDVLEVVFPRATHNDLVLSHSHPTVPNRRESRPAGDSLAQAKTF